MHFPAIRYPVAVLVFIAVALFGINSVQAAAGTATVGQTVTFSVTADGTAPFTYQWYKGGANIAGATGATYSISSAQLTDAGSYYVVVSNSAGSTTSDNATLTVNSAAVAPVFTTQPASQTVTAGASVTFTAAASGSPTPTYQWRKGGVNIAGATSTSYTIASVATGDAGTYTVVATNSAGSATSNGAVLTVNPAAVAPVFTTQPASQTVTAGASVTFTAAASGSPAPTYQWRENSVNIAGATSTSYTIASVATGDAGTYTVVATNSAGSATSSGAVLTVNTAPSIITQPANQTVTAGQNVTFSVTAAGNPSPTYQWQRSVDGGIAWNNLSNDSTFSGVTTAALMIISPTAVMNGDQYRCLMTNSVGSVVSNAAVLTVNVAPSNVQIAIQIN